MNWTLNRDITLSWMDTSLSAHGAVMKRLGQCQGALPLKLTTYEPYAPLFRRCMPCPEP